VQAPPGFKGSFRTDDTARALYAEGAGVFRIIPAAVAVPTGRDDLVRLTRWALEEDVALVPRGAGSGMPGGNVGPGVIVDLTRGFRGGPAVDADARLVRAGASVTCRELNDAAQPFALRLPPDPSSAAFCTVGGMVATNAAGARSLKYGPIRSWVEELEFVTADGEVGRAGPGEVPSTEGTAAERRFHEEIAPGLFENRAALDRAWPRTRKNASGYSLTHHMDCGWIRNLLVGSEGTLALVTEVTLRLAPLPERRATLLGTLRSLDEVGAAVATLAPLEPSAVELLDKTYLDFVRAAAQGHVPADTEAVLLIEMEDDGEEARTVLGRTASSVALAQDPAAESRLWELRHLASPILAALPDGMRSLQVVEDGCVPLERLGQYVSELRAIATRHRFQVVIFGHAGDGHVHANLLADVSQPDLAQRLEECLERVSALQARLGGTLSGEHGDGRLRAAHAHRVLGDLYMEYCRRVKAAWDPAGILNPGVKVSPAAGRDARVLAPESLKVGRLAPRLPREVAELLRRIEREAAWGHFKLDFAPQSGT
jgi:FAD/FMN-containing dehydrogenase